MSFREKTIYKHIDRYLKNRVLKCIDYVIKHVKFKLYAAHPDRVIWKN